MHVTSGDAQSFTIEFRVGGELVIPDANTVTAQLRDQSGALVAGWNPKTIDHAGLNTVVIEVEGADNTAVEREKRTLVVTYKVAGATYKTTLGYFVTPWINTSVTYDDVRTFFGVNAEELPDSFIKIEDAYYEAVATYDKVEFDQALADTGTMRLANEMILGFAARPLVQVLKVRLMQSESSDQERYARFAKLDLDGFLAKINSMIVGNAMSLFNVSEEIPIFFDVATPTDPITGA
jgi:hypothetical protein